MNPLSNAATIEQGTAQGFHGTLSSFGHPQRIIRRYVYRSWFGFLRIGRFETTHYPEGHALHTWGELQPHNFVCWLD